MCSNRYLRILMKNGEKTSAHMRWEGRDIAVSGAVDSKKKIDKLMPV